MNIQNGIVLKHFVPKRQKLALLDKVLGRIEVVTTREALSTGTVVEYQLYSKKCWYVADRLEIIAMPFAVARDDVLFLHHILEIVYHFIPEGMRAQRVYELLLFVYDMGVLSVEQKKIALSVLFALLGIYPEDAPAYVSFMQTLLAEPFAIMFKRKIDTRVEKYIAGWLYQCIMVHAGAQQFKTIHFLHEIR